MDIAEPPVVSCTQCVLLDIYTHSMSINLILFARRCLRALQTPSTSVCTFFCSLFLRVVTSYETLLLKPAVEVFSRRYKA